jgi:hypothetical protein
LWRGFYPSGLPVRYLIAIIRRSWTGRLAVERLCYALGLLVTSSDDAMTLCHV